MLASCCLLVGMAATSFMRSRRATRALEKQPNTVAVFLAPPEMSFAGLFGSMIEIRLVSRYTTVLTWL